MFGNRRYSFFCVLAGRAAIGSCLICIIHPFASFAVCDGSQERCDMRCEE
jgi:hypothetical protein